MCLSLLLPVRAAAAFFAATSKLHHGKLHSSHLVGACNNLSNQLAAKRAAKRAMQRKMYVSVTHMSKLTRYMSAVGPEGKALPEGSCMPCVSKTTGRPVASIAARYVAASCALLLKSNLRFNDNVHDSTRSQLANERRKRAP